MTTVSLRRSVAPEQASKTEFRPDIQGLRALAVVAVIGNHLLDWPSQGFIGVDVFFVISGYLITGLLLREHGRSGTVSLAAFYRRRAKRILPAALLVLVATVLGSYALLNEARAQAVFGDAVWALLFSANWHFIAVGTDYFQAQGPVSPLEHFWSLGVEEQFYLVWPWLIVGSALVLGRRVSARRARVAVVAVLALVVVASFGWALWETSTTPTLSYFSTFSRAWELGIGGLLAAVAGLTRRLPTSVGRLLAWVGLAIVVIGFFVIPGAAGFPAPWAAVPVIGAAAVIVGGSTGGKAPWPLTNGGSVWIGDLSYSLYVWHFPVVVLLASLIPPGPLYYLLAVPVLLLVSVGSYYLVEEPIRRSPLLDRRRARARRNTHVRGPRAAAAKKALWTVAICCACLVVAAYLRQTTAPRISADAVVPSPLTTASGPDAVSASTAALQTRLSAALARKSWPILQPSVADLDHAWAPEWVQDNCLNVNEVDVVRCRWGGPGAKRLAVVIGDSIAISYLPGLRAALPASAWSVQSLTFGQCPASQVGVTNDARDAGFAKLCADHLRLVVDQIRRMKPDLVIAASAPNSIERNLSDGTTGSAAFYEYERGAAKLLTSIKPDAGRIVLLDPPPGTKNLVQCDTRLSAPEDCVQQVPDDYYDFTDADAAAAKSAGVSDVATVDWFCVQEQCPAFTGSVPTYVDGEHLTAAAARSLRPVLSDAIGAG